MSTQKELKKELPKQLILKRKGTRLFHFPKPNAKPVKVYPGVNIFDDPKDIKQIMEHHAFQGLIEAGAHTILNQMPGAKTIKTKVFSAMTVPQCKKIISDTLSIPALEGLRAQEMARDDRKGVKNAIEDQIRMLKNPSNDDLSK